MSIGEALRRLRFFVRRKRFAAGLEEEMRLHIELRMRKLRDEGTPREDATHQARRKFGNPIQIKEKSRDMWGGNWLEALTQDLRYGLRQFWQNPGFTATVIATLALGIGANTAIFTIINGVILRPLPYPESERLVRLNESPNWSFAYLNFLDCQRAAHSFEAMAAWRQHGGNLTAPGEPQYVGARQVSAGFFSVLGVPLALGREFLPEEDKPGARPVAILSHKEWQERFGGDSKAIGSSIVLDGTDRTVVGVLPSDFHFFGDRRVYTPIGQNTEISMRDRQIHPGIYVLARLKTGVSLGQASIELHWIGHQLAHQFPETNASHTIDLMALKRAIIGDIGPTLYLLAGAVGLVLLIACTNVANLLLARSMSRSQELSIRAALGASRARVIRQILSESALLGIGGGLAGFLIASLGIHSALSHLPGDLPRLEEIAPDGRVLLFTIATSAFTGIFFGLAPALRHRFDLEASLRQGARGTSRGVRRIQSSFVMAEVALALVLLVGAGLMLRTILRLWSVNPGFDPRHLMVMSVALSPKVSDDPAVIRTEWRGVLERVAKVPGVEAAAVNTIMPMDGDESSLQYWIGPTRPPQDKIPMALIYTPTPDYLRALKIPLLRGRFFTEQDQLASERVVVIDDLLAQRAFPGRDPVGAQVSLQLLGPVRIVGIVGHVKHWSLDEETRTATEEIYFPFNQIPDPFMKLIPAGMELAVRTSLNPQPVIQGVRQAVLGPFRDQPVHSLQTMEAMIGDSLGRRRLMWMLLAAFASIALVLSSVGIYGVISYSTGQRVSEIGIRMALGARPDQVLELILRQGMLMVLAGVGAGALASIPLMRLMKSMLYGVPPEDPLTFGAVVVILCAVAWAAAYIPANRASRVDPLRALRHE